MSGLILPAGSQRPAGTLIDAGGSPTPPTRLIERLRDISDGLTVRWHPMLRRFAVMHAWAPNDPRRALVQSGELGDDAYDVVCYLPEGQDPETVGDYIVEQIHRCDLEKNPLRRNLLYRIREMQHHNERVKQKNMEALVEPVLEEVKYQARYILDDNTRGRIAAAEGVSVKYD